MSEVEYKNTIKVGKRTLDVRTVFQASETAALAEVSDNGKLIETRVKSFSDELPEKEQRRRVEEFHKSILDEIELIFFMAEKVRSTQHSQSTYKIGQVFLHHKFYTEAINSFKSAIKQDPAHGEWQNDLGVAYFLDGNMNKAEQAFLKGIKEKSEYPDIHYNLGFCRWKMGKYIEAIAALRNAIELNNDYTNALFVLGLVLLESSEKKPKEPKLSPPIERSKEGIELIRQAIDRCSDCQVERLEKGLNLLDDRKMQEAIDEMVQAKPDLIPSVHLAPEDEFYTKFMFGGIDKNDEIVNSHIEEMLERIREHPTYADLHYDLAVAYLIKARNLFLSALDEFQHAIELNPSFEKAKKSLKLVENDGRGMLILLRALLK